MSPVGCEVGPGSLLQDRCPHRAVSRAQCWGMSSWREQLWFWGFVAAASLRSGLSPEPPAVTWPRVTHCVVSCGQNGWMPRL